MCIVPGTMKHESRGKTGAKGAGKPGSRIVRSISIRPDQDLWLEDAFGGEGNASAFVRGLIDLAMDGKVPKSAGEAGPERTALERALAYQRAKEAALLFEEDVAEAVGKWARAAGLKVTRGRIHNETPGMVFVADFSLERGDGEVVASVCCKSSSRPDRVEMAIGEAIIGRLKTGRPVVTVMPYLTDEGRKVLEKRRPPEDITVELAGLGEALGKLPKSPSVAK